MADTTVTHTIFFIAAVMVAASLAGVFIGLSQDMAHSINDRSDRIRELADSDFVILNDPANMPYSGGTLSVYLKNLSTRTLSESLDVFIDGALFTEYSIAGHQNGSEWFPSGVITLNIGLTLAGGDHHLKVVLSNGAFAELMFRI